MPRLAIVMIVKNEAHCLAQCLNSVAPCADDLIICDTGSTDNTVEVAQSFGAHVSTIPWHNDFAEARNRSLARANAQWLLHLDADEVLDADGAARIRALVDADGPADAFELTLANYSNDIRAWRWRPSPPGDPMARGFAGYIPAPLLRLFRNGRGFHYREPIHENITESVIERGGIIASEPVIIHHYGYECDPTKARQKALTYHQIARRKSLDRPNDPKTWLDLAEQAFAVGQQAEAETAARRAVALAPSDVAPATSLANMLLIRGALDEARPLLQRFAGPDAPAHVLVALGAIALRQGRVDDAEQVLQQAVDVHPWAVQAKVSLARVRNLQHRPAEASALLLAAAQTAPAVSELANLLQAHETRIQAEKALDDNQLAHALRLLRDALVLDPEDPLIHVAVARALDLAGQPERAQQSRQNARRLCPALEQ